LRGRKERKDKRKRKEVRVRRKDYFVVPPAGKIKLIFRWQVNYWKGQ